MRAERAVRSIALGVMTLGVLWIACCGGNPRAAPPAKLRVLAAASLADAFREIGIEFEGANPGTRVEFSFAGSNQLRTQLQNGGPGDVFASADREQMDAATASGLVVPATVSTFAHNRLAVIVPRANKTGIRQLSDLGRPGLKVIVADSAVPVGAYTRLMLERAGGTPALGPAFVTAFQANIVSKEENVAAVVAKVTLNEADAGIAYASEAAGSNGAGLTVIPLPADLDRRTDDVAAVVARSAEPTLAGRFVDFLTSATAATTLEKRGLIPAGTGSP